MSAELPPHARTLGVVAWCSFLVAGAATMVLFAFLDPAVLPWLLTRHAVYALGFFFFWMVAALAAALAIYMARTERK